MAKNKAMQQDLKYAATLLGGSLLVSLVFILLGNLLSSSNLPVITEAGNVVSIIGWAWVIGTVGAGLLVRVRMRQLYGSIPVRIGK